MCKIIYVVRSEQCRDCKEKMCEVKLSFEEAMRFYGYEKSLNHLKEESKNTSSYLSSLPSELLSTISQYISHSRVSYLKKNEICKEISQK